MALGLKPFWRYYGGKWRAAPRYPAPRHNHIVEPFAGSAGYAMRYPDLSVTLVEKYAVVAEIWRYLIGSSCTDILSIPCVENVDDLPGNTPEGAKHLVGFCLNSATTSPRRTLSTGAKRQRASGRTLDGWSEARRARVASQIDRIHHWTVIEGDYTAAPGIQATWFIDPPYNNTAGAYYKSAVDDYANLATWCESRQGQVIVCENEGAAWLPFESIGTFKAGLNGRGSKEVMWVKDSSG